jgi:hypothetical protein
VVATAHHCSPVKAATAIQRSSPRVG